MTENELITKAKSGDVESLETLISLYKPLVSGISRGYFLTMGGDNDDLVQEGTLGLLSAIKGFDPERTAGFRTFAAQCIRNRIKDALRKSRGLTAEVLADQMPEDAAPPPDPFADFVDKERVDELFAALNKSLTEEQSRILSLYLKGYKYQEIAKRLDKSTKFIDNTLSKIKTTVKKHLKDDL